MSSIFIFQGTSILLSIVAEPIYIPTNSGNEEEVGKKSSFFSMFLLPLIFLITAIFVVLICTFLIIIDVEHLFMYLLAI